MRILNELLPEYAPWDRTKHARGEQTWGDIWCCPEKRDACPYFVECKYGKFGWALVKQWKKKAIEEAAAIGKARVVLCISNEVSGQMVMVFDLPEGNPAALDWCDWEKLQEQKVFLLDAWV